MTQPPKEIMKNEYSTILQYRELIMVAVAVVMILVIVIMYQSLYIETYSYPQAFMLLLLGLTLTKVVLSKVLPIWYTVITISAYFLSAYLLSYQHTSAGQHITTSKYGMVALAVTTAIDGIVSFYFLNNSNGIIKYTVVAQVLVNLIITILAIVAIVNSDV